MLTEVKSKLLDNPESIQHILETFGFDKVRIRNNEIRCAFEHGMNPTAVVIRLRDNENLFVKDYERNVSYDLVNYLVKEKNIPFKDVINEIKRETGIDSLYTYKKSVGLFGGIYNAIKKPNEIANIKTYPDDILKAYVDLPSVKWLADGIGIETQRKWRVGYDVTSQRITLPIRTPTGEIMAIKGRANFELTEFEPKYLYLEQGPMSQTLFGFSENYDHLYGGDLLLFESEKSVLILDGWGYHNALALGSNSLSTTQARLLMSLNPKSITFMFDNNLPLDNTKRNVEILQQFCKMHNVKIKFWNWEDNLSIGYKCAPCDEGREEFEYILENEIVDAIELTTQNE